MERRGGDGVWSAPRGRRRRGRAEEEEEAEARQGRRLQEARAELQASEFWRRSLKVLLGALREVAAPAGGRWRCVCFGLGNFASCFRARGQLAFLLLLLRELQIPEERCCVFDPAFCALERDVLSGLGLSLLSRNEEGKCPVHEPTIFYMIHCGKALYNNLLWSNWSAEALSQMVIVGNSFKGIEERVPTRIFQVDYAYIAKVLPASVEAALPPHDQQLEVFNDTAVHCFPWRKLQEVPPETWGFQDEPAYPSEDQAEIIRNTDEI
ncbi:SRR1-like protein [Paroedura picta]|uniref:SRR1-like protein n=1 Tax=Paroedura picta TaxID=143630 RepID=UPI0040568C3E